MRSKCGYFFPFDVTQAPDMHSCLWLQHTVLLQQVSPLAQTVLPQHAEPLGLLTQVAVAPLPQHRWPFGQLVLPQHCLLPSAQNGDVPVVQQILPFLHGGEQVCALSDAGAHAAITPPNIAPPISRITPRRDVGFASSRARLSMN